MSDITSPRSFPRRGWLALVVAVVAACSGDKAAPKTTLQSMTIGAGTGAAYAAVGVPQQLSVVGTYSDGTTAALTAGVTWTSSDESIASVDERGRLSPWRVGDGVVLTATHVATGVTATTSLSCRDVVRVPVNVLNDGSVDRAETYFRVSGMVPGALYVSKVSGMTDDVDVAVYGDVSMSPDAELCVSDKIGRYDESCVSRANGAGELFVKVDGQWTNAGARFSFDVAPAQRVPLADTLAFPSAFPRAGSIGPVRELYKVTGLAANSPYQVRISQPSADIDLQVYYDDYEYTLLCSSYQPGTAEDSCAAHSTTDGELFVLISGETTTGGGTYTLAVTKQ